MSKLRASLAVDIVLLLPVRIANLAIRLNRTLASSNKPTIKLGQQSCLPHVTLVMGCIPATSLLRLKQSLRTLVRQQPPLRITITKLSSQPWERIDRIYTLEIAQSPRLQQLHEQAVALLKLFTTRRATVASLHPDTPPDPAAAKWVNNYITASSFAKYWPHITVGMGRTNTKLPSPAFFTAARLGLCHIGHVGTCYRLLWQSRLKKRR